MTSESEPSEKSSSPSAADAEPKAVAEVNAVGSRNEEGSERFGSVAPMSSPIVSVGSAGLQGGLGAEEPVSDQPAPSARKLVPPPKPKRDSTIPPPQEGQPEGRPYFPLPSTPPVRSTGAMPSMGSMRPASTSRPSIAPLRPDPGSVPSLPTAQAVAKASPLPPRPLSQHPAAPVLPAQARLPSSFPKAPGFPAARSSSSPPPTLPSATNTTSSQYPWISSATSALADGKVPQPIESQPAANVPSRTSARPDSPSGDTTKATPASIEPPPTSQPSGAPRAAVLPRATRDPLRRSSTPPPKPRLVPPRPQKETPTVAIEAMRIIAIGVDDNPRPEEPGQPERPSTASFETSARMAESASEFAPIRLPFEAVEEEQATEEPACIGADAVSVPGPAALNDASQTPPEPTEELVALSDAEAIPDNSQPPRLTESSSEAQSVAPRKPPPPKRVSLGPAPPERALGAAPQVSSEPHLTVVEISERDEEVEAVDSVETVEVVPHKPPEPPRRSKPKADEEEARPAPKPPTHSEKPKRRAWWEELFNEDFSRAIVRLSGSQVDQDVNFIEESLGVAPGAVVLDLGCGCGDHAVELASRGYGVVGYDLSLHQLALAQETAQEREQKINFLQGDMREMAFEEVFDGVYCWNTTFGYFEEDKNVAVLDRIFHALKPGGALLLDVINRDFATADQPSSLWYEGDCCVCMDDMSIDFLASRLRVKRSLILDDGRTRECNYSIRLYSLHELGKILHDTGFRVTEASGHPSMPGVFFGQSSPRIIILAQKP